MSMNFRNSNCRASCNVRRYYLKVTNKGNLCIQFILQYDVHGGTATKQSKVLNTGESDRLIFTNDSSNIYFNILNCSLPSAPLIYNGVITNFQNTCYEIHGTVENPLCIQCPC